jgi:predicted patatin/cPLA2 family phospholipase
MSKIGLVSEGGGMRGVYGAGVLDLFLDECLDFEYCLAVSAGSGNMASFLAGQRKRNYNFYTVYSRDKRYMSASNLVRTGSFFGLEYIYGTLTNEIDPINYEKLLNTQSIFKVVATSAQTGRPVYFSNSDFKLNDCRVLMASSAIPIACKPIKINNGTYFDGGISDPIPVKKAIEDGCDKIVAILSKPRGFVKKPERASFLFSSFLKNYPNVVSALKHRHEVYAESLTYLYELERQGRAIVIAPSQQVKANFATKNPRVLDELYELGISDAKASLSRLKCIV